MENTDQFIGKINKVGNSLMITIPAKHAEFGGLLEGDWLTVWYQKKEKDKEE